MTNWSIRRVLRPRTRVSLELQSALEAIKRSGVESKVACVRKGAGKGGVMGRVVTRPNAGWNKKGTRRQEFVWGEGEDQKTKKKNKKWRNAFSPTSSAEQSGGGDEPRAVHVHVELTIKVDTVAGANHVAALPTSGRVLH